ncbi:hypothetical protein M406DRAFT_350417 [Cryphonectria parasitica EP155]|uniref:Uncharacterized protein n=1 Tax=Cryphonectria parasitica (strain ATCC 38755 / EP155) TaxID=660469 RepID=A0A9P4Y5K3_CRYP1|nr:uncharacterized protein M406DRAFT_350417 [Cryphonectria parasitica EP155]KAF3767128.1 hypothetical protein M406DRAFT_350417 [Cryphonectria parasitica EP155]
MSATQHQQNPSINTSPDADLAARLAAPVSPTTEKSAAEAMRRTSEWHPPSSSSGSAPRPQRTFSFDREDHKHAMMAASGTLSARVAPGAGDASGFSEKGAPA